jgi:SAM-dependent methyltransferase
MDQKYGLPTWPTWWRQPGGAPLDGVRLLSEKMLVDSSNRVLGNVVAEEQRIEWSVELLRQEFAQRVDEEQVKYDSWAVHQKKVLEGTIFPLDPGERGMHWWSSPVFEQSELLRSIKNSAKLMQLSDNRILDIGGSLLHSWRFLFYGNASHLDHVDVSAATQSLAYWRAKQLFQKVPDLIDRLHFHTTAAETLPFSDNSFDFVFSLATIHHTQRPDVFFEIKRVLKSGGIFWMIEPIMGLVDFQLMKASRFLRRADRGTDNPLRQFEIDSLAEIMSIDRDDRYTYLAPFLKFLAHEANCVTPHSIRRNSMQHILML